MKLCSGKTENERLVESEGEWLELYLFLEVANGVFISISEKIQNAVLDVVLLKMIHQVCAVALNINTQTIINKSSERHQFNSKRIAYSILI